MTNETLFGKICMESLTRQYNDEMLACKEDASCSFLHRKKMSKILGYRVKGTMRMTKGAIAAILVAAILLLASCAAYLCREHLSDFIAEIYEKFLFMTDEFDNTVDEDLIIKDVYTLAYVPEGYEKVKEGYSSTSVFYIWQNIGGGEITFRQMSNVDTFLHLDDMVDKEKIILNDVTVFYYKSGNWYNYIWRDEAYYMLIRSNHPINDTELGKMIKGLKK